MFQLPIPLYLFWQQLIFLFIISILKSLVVPAICLAPSSVICSRITQYFVALKSICSNKSVLNRSIFALYRITSVSNTRRDVKVFNIGTDWILRFQNGCNKVLIELRVVQFWSEIILVISNRTRAARSSNFKITRMISDQIAFQSVQLPLCILHNSVFLKS